MNEEKEGTGCSSIGSQELVSVVHSESCNAGRSYSYSLQ